MDKSPYNRDGYGYDQPPVNTEQPPKYTDAPGWTQDAQPEAVTPMTSSNTTLIQMQPNAAPGVLPTQTIIFQQPETYSMCGHYCFSCFVFWFCNLLFGAIAFFVALCGSGRPAASAKSYGTCSMVLNIIGIVISLAVVGAVLAMYFTGTVIFADQTAADIINNGINDVSNDMDDMQNHVINSVQHLGKKVEDYVYTG